MKMIHLTKAWGWAGVVLVLVVLAILAYIFLLGRADLPAQPAPDYWPTAGWRTTTPEQQGIDSAALASEIRNIQDSHTAIDSLLVIRNGYVVMDAYFAPYNGSFPHDVASVTKSVMTSLIGIAVDQGKLQLDQTVVSFFPGRSIANLDARKKSLTIRDLVSMRNGMESGCFHNDLETLDKMRSQADWVQAALDRSMTSAPGSKFCYDSPGMHLLSAILQQASGMTALDFARQNLFGPLGIQDVVWESDPQGYTHGWGDLHLKPLDAAKLGLLWLHGGNWDGKQIVTASWVSDSIKVHSRMVGEEYGYGYGWWVSPVHFYAKGRGGQFIHVIPSLNTVLVITSGGPDMDTLRLVKLLLGFHKTLPANPAGVADLAAAIASAAQGAGQPAPSSTPGMAGAVSGRTFACDPNKIGVSSVRFDFNDPSTGGFFLVMNGQEFNWPIGLDGTYRMSADGQETSGYWKDKETFVINLFDIGQQTRLFHFTGNDLEVTIPELEMTLACHVQNP
jgi:CubicO group peptidase (beta-lactamase class C family)